MTTHGSCPYADRNVSSNNIHCMIQRESKAKWDFCINQNYCRATNLYSLKPESNNCKLRLRKDGDK